jgi:hypothetical protein
MRTRIESTLVSLDGVSESPECWSPFDEEATRLAMEDLGNYDAFVTGRVTYERLRANWAPSAATRTSSASTPCPSTSPLARSPR